MFLCASDYPHEPKEDFVEGLEEFEEREDVPEDAKANILWANPVRFFNLNEAEIKAAAEQKTAATA